jgi:hypothetical protein
MPDESTPVPPNDPPSRNTGPAAEINQAGPWRKSRRRLSGGLAAGVMAVVLVAFFLRSHEKKRTRHAPSKEKGAPSSAATKKAPFVNSLGMKFVPVPIIHGPTGGQRVLFDVWDTRVQDYEVFARETKRDWPKPPFEQGPAHPAVDVTWEDVNAFCAWLTDRERKVGKLGADEVYRLPSDHEWSCAAGIGGSEDPDAPPNAKSKKIGDMFPWGKEWPPPAGSGNYAGEELQPALDAGKYSYIRDGVIRGYRDGFTETSPVGSFPANRLGLYDMGGNVWQWCEDYYNKDQKDHVMRGGAWNYAGRGGLLSSNRPHYAPGYRYYYAFGFRCVIAPAPSER